MEFQTCKCGCTIFETIVTKQYDASDFYIDSRSKDIRTAVSGVPAAKCIECGRISVPSTSMAGISVMDPRVGAYRELLRAIEVRNNTLEKEYNISALSALEQKVSDLSEKSCQCAILEVKEVPVVETTTGSRKKSKVAISGPSD